MRISLSSIPLYIALAVPAYSQPAAGFPLVNSVEPESGRAGDVLNAHGENLGQDTVASVYLTDGKTDTKVLIIEQTAKSIKFRIPPEAKPGRFALMVLTKGQNPKLIEEPVKITIDAETALLHPVDGAGDQLACQVV